MSQEVCPRCVRRCRPPPSPAPSPLQVWVVVQGGRCGYGLGSGSWKLMPGRGDVINGTLCSFMQTENSDSHLFNLPDGTKKLLITPAPHAF